MAALTVTNKAKALRFVLWTNPNRYEYTVVILLFTLHSLLFTYYPLLCAVAPRNTYGTLALGANITHHSFMEAVIFIGIQGAGKSTFYRNRFLDTHIRINLDMLKTRHREKIILHACLEAKQRFVVDNTNPTVEDRSRYIIPGKAKNFQIVAYYFQSNLEDCKQRNSQRPPKKVIPLAGLLATHKKLVVPTLEEGFDAIYSVKTNPDYSFTVEEMNKR